MNPIEAFLYWAEYGEAPFASVVVAILGATLVALVALCVAAGVALWLFNKSKTN
jgi:hypothetical protein